MKECLGAVGLRPQHVVERQPEFLRELADAGVALVDQLAAVFGNLSLGEIPAPRPATPADPRVRLVDRRVDARLLQPVRAGETGQTGAHHHDPGVRLRRFRRAEKRSRRERCGRSPQP